MLYWCIRESRINQRKELNSNDLRIDPCEISHNSSCHQRYAPPTFTLCILLDRKSYMGFSDFISKSYAWSFRPGWERYAIAIARSRTRHIKNTCMVCCTPKTYGVLSHVFPIQSFSTFLIILSTITLSKCSVRLTFNFLFTFLLS